MYSLSTKKWNTPFDISPVNIENTGNITATTGAALTLAPDFLGGDDTLRISFVGLYTNDAEAGVYRIKNTTDKDIYDGDDTDIWSLDYDGTNLVAGSAIDNKVYRCSDPLDSSPTFSTTGSLKRPGLSGATKVVVAWNGADVVAGTTGPGSAFSVSKDDGKSFNDISMIDTVAGNLGQMLDLQVSADGSVMYMLSRDGATWYEPLPLRRQLGEGARGWRLC
jgi:hypothetical protein